MFKYTKLNFLQIYIILKKYIKKNIIKKIILNKKNKYEL